MNPEQEQPQESKLDRALAILEMMHSSEVEEYSELWKKLDQDLMDLMGELTPEELNKFERERIRKY